MKQFIVLSLMMCIPGVVAVDRAPSYFMTALDIDTHSELLDIIELSDGGFLGTGGTYTGPDDELLLVKYQSDGSAAWAAYFDDGEATLGHAVLETTEMNLMVLGYFYSDTDDEQGLLAKFNPAGLLQWVKTFGGNFADQFNSIVQVTDGGFVIAGSYHTDTTENLIFSKFDSSGNPVWSNLFGGYNNEKGYCLKKTSDNGFIFAGSTNSFGSGSLDGILIKFDSLGTISWARTIGSTDAEALFSVAQTADDGYIATGEFWGNTFGETDVYLVKHDSLGTFSWARRIGTVDDEVPECVIQIPDGGYVLAGRYREMVSNNADGLLMKCDSSGNPVWAKRYGNTGYDRLNTVALTSDGGLIFSGVSTSYGTANSEAFTIKTGIDGTILNCNEITDITMSVTSPAMESTTLGLTPTPLALVVADKGVGVDSIFPNITTVCFYDPSPSTPTPTPSADCIHHGDVNFSNSHTANDAQMAFSITMGSLDPTYLENCAADCNNDGGVTAGDAQTIFFIVMGYGSCVDGIPTGTPTPTPTPT